MTSLTKTALIVPVMVVALSGCAMMPGQMSRGATPMGGSPGMVGPSAGPSAPTATPAGQQMASPFMDAAQQQQRIQQSQVSNEVASLRERVRRVERAMIRLDRRMQLMERNELARISSLGMSGEGTEEPSGLFQPMGFGNSGFGGGMEAPTARRAPQASSLSRPLGPQGGNFQPVSMVKPVNQPSGVITSSLQPAPAQPQQRVAKNSFSSLPSLADSQGRQAKDEASVSIWTITYEDSKVWPAREQLSASRDVVDALRDGKPVALFARGARPASREFRERVRAVSKYLSKVADMENVPIASMPAKHLDGDTIEILATK